MTERIRRRFGTIGEPRFLVQVAQVIGHRVRIAVAQQCLRQAEAEMSQLGQVAGVPAELKRFSKPASSRVFPMPASPATIMTPPFPFAERAMAI